jgi:hypothetical protein
MLLARRPIKAVDAYILACEKWFGDGKKLPGIMQTLRAFSAFPRVFVFLDRKHVPDAEAQLAKYQNMTVVRYKGGSIRRAVRYAEDFARKHSIAYVITDSDITWQLAMKIIDPATMKLMYGLPVILPKGSLMKNGRARKVARPSSWSRKLGIPGPDQVKATPEATYATVLLAANIARNAGYSGWTFNHRNHPGDGYNGWNAHTPFHGTLCQGNFRGFFSDAPGSYADVPDRFFDVNLEDFHRTYQCSKVGKSGMMAYRLADLGYHVDKERQATRAHREAAYELQDLFRGIGLDAEVFPTRVKNSYSLRLIERETHDSFFEVNGFMKATRTCSNEDCGKTYNPMSPTHKGKIDECPECGSKHEVVRVTGTENFSGNPYKDGFRSDGVTILSRKCSVR